MCTVENSQLNNAVTNCFLGCPVTITPSIHGSILCKSPPHTLLHHPIWPDKLQSETLRPYAAPLMLLATFAFIEPVLSTPPSFSSSFLFTVPSRSDHHPSCRIPFPSPPTTAFSLIAKRKITAEELLVWTELNGYNRAGASNGTREMIRENQTVGIALAKKPLVIESTPLSQRPLTKRAWQGP
jgi:hypothetical protein